MSTRHTAILTDFYEKLTLKYEQNFKRSTEHCKSETLSLKREIDRLSVELDSTRRTIRSVGTRRPVYSPGKYTDTKIDNVARLPNSVPYLDTMKQLRKEFGIKPD